MRAEEAATDSDVVKALNAIRSRQHVPALGGALVNSQGLLAQGAVGVRKSGEKVLVTKSDRWHLGSDTKAMTAVLIARLIEQGKLDWETTLGTVFADLAPAFPQGFRDITVTQLLSHRAGLPGNPDWTDYEQVLQSTPSVPRQRIELLKKAASRGVVAPPGTQYRYSSLGYMLAGLVAEHITGKTWEELMREIVFRPLGMNGCGFGGTGTPGKIDQPWPHRSSGEPTPMNGPAVDNPPALAPAGGIHCTLSDWSKFVADQLKGAGGKTALLKMESYRRLHLSRGDDCAMGWFVVSGEGWAGGNVLQHYGTNMKNFAVVRMAPRRGFAVLVVTNQGGDGAKKAIDEAADALVRLHVGR